MTLNELTTSYRLERRTVTPFQLLLDPTNPRLIADSSEYRHFSEEEIQAPATQSQVLSRVCSKEHGVKQLIDSIKDMGFIGGLHEMIVKKLGSADRFLVLEGNRRTAALQHLLRDQNSLRPDVRQSIQRIDVQQLIYLPNPNQSEEEVTDIILGTIHIDGPKEWGALERSHYIYRTYMRDLGQRSFRYDPDTSKRVGVRFKMSNRAVKTLVTISRIYEQLKAAALPIQPRHYSLIELAVKTRALSRGFFEIDDEDCSMSALGVERFADLCLGVAPPIHNPKLFQAFTSIYTEGTDLEREQALRGDRDIEVLLGGIHERKKRRAFSEDLDGVIDVIERLRPSEFNGTNVERDKIRRIQQMISRKLMPLING